MTDVSIGFWPPFWSPSRLGSSMASPYKSLLIWVKHFNAYLAVNWILVRGFANSPFFLPDSGLYLLKVLIFLFHLKPAISNDDDDDDNPYCVVHVRYIWLTVFKSTSQLVKLNFLSHILFLLYQDAVVSVKFSPSVTYFVTSLSGCCTISEVFSIRTFDCLSIKRQNCPALGSERVSIK